MSDAPNVNGLILDSGEVLFGSIVVSSDLSAMEVFTKYVNLSEPLLLASIEDDNGNLSHFFKRYQLGIDMAYNLVTINPERIVSVFKPDQALIDLYITSLKYAGSVIEPRFRAGINEINSKLSAVFDNMPADCTDTRVALAFAGLNTDVSN